MNNNELLQTISWDELTHRIFKKIIKNNGIYKIDLQRFFKLEIDLFPDVYSQLIFMSMRDLFQSNSDINSLNIHSNILANPKYEKYLEKRTDESINYYIESFNNDEDDAYINCDLNMMVEWLKTYYINHRLQQFDVTKGNYWTGVGLQKLLNESISFFQNLNSINEETKNNRMAGSVGEIVKNNVTNNSINKIAFENPIKAMRSVTPHILVNEFYLIAGVSGVGKTMFLFFYIILIAIQDLEALKKSGKNPYNLKKKPIYLIFEQEMADFELESRLTFLNNFPMLTDYLTNIKVFYNCTTPEKIETKIKELGNIYTIRTIGIDYFQLMDCEKNTLNDKTKFDHNVSKILYIKNNYLIPIIALSQLTKEATQKISDKERVGLNGIMGSGSLMYSATKIDYIDQAIEVLENGTPDGVEYPVLTIQNKKDRASKANKKDDTKLIKFETMFFNSGLELENFVNTLKELEEWLYPLYKKEQEELGISNSNEFNLDLLKKEKEDLEKINKKLNKEIEWMEEVKKEHQSENKLLNEQIKVFEKEEIWESEWDVVIPKEEFEKEKIETKKLNELLAKYPELEELEVDEVEVDDEEVIDVSKIFESK